MKEIKRNGRSRGFLRKLLVLAFFFVSVTLGEVEGGHPTGRLNLPQTPFAQILKGKAHQEVKALFTGKGISQLFQPNRPVPEEAQRILLGLLPPAFRAGCREMVGGWGEVARGTEQLAVRFLSLHKLGQDLQIFLAYRGFSSHEVYRETFYDERLAVLSIHGTFSSFRIIPHDPDLPEDSTLSRLNFGEILDLPGATGFSLLVSRSSENPCCGGPASFHEERLMIFVFSPEGVNEALSVPLYVEDLQHDDQGGDTTTTYRGKISFEKDPKGDLTGLELTYQKASGGEMVSQGVARYFWDKEKKKFGQFSRPLPD